MLKTRILTALVIAPIALLGLFYLSVPNFKWFLLLILMVSGWEWANFARLQPLGRVVYASGLGALFFVSSNFLMPWLAAAVLWWGHRFMAHRSISISVNALAAAGCDWTHWRRDPDSVWAQLSVVESAE